MTHGLDIKLNNDRFIALADEAVYAFSVGARPGAYLVDWIPAREPPDPCVISGR